MPERCVAARCSNVGDPEKHFNEQDSVLRREMPDKAKKEKKVDQLPVGEKKDVGAGEGVLVVLRALYCGRFLKAVEHGSKLEA